MGSNHSQSRITSQAVQGGSRITEDIAASGGIGATGPEGPAGADGAVGATGVDGIDGAIGATGPAGAGGGDHGGLTGLADDDHSQYLLVDGTRAMTGNLTLSGDRTITTSAGTDDLFINPLRELGLGTISTDAINIGRTDAAIATTLRGTVIMHTFDTPAEQVFAYDGTDTTIDATSTGTMTVGAGATGVNIGTNSTSADIVLGGVNLITMRPHTAYKVDIGDATYPFRNQYNTTGTTFWNSHDLDCTDVNIGVATTDTLGFWGATPIAQPASANQAIVSGTAVGTDATLINDLKTLVNQLRSDLISSGNIKGSA